MSRRYSGPGWTVTGGPGSRGRQLPPLPGGGVDWSRPACEPDNRPHLLVGRALAVFTPILAVGPVLWFAIPVMDRFWVRVGAWLAVHDVNVSMVLTGVAGTILAGCGVVGLVRSCGSAAPRSATADSGRVRVDITTVTTVPPPAVTYPVGQLVFRVFDSPAMLAAAAAPRLTPESPAAPAVAVQAPDQGRGRLSGGEAA